MAVASPTGTIAVEGHELHAEDIRLLYTFDQTTGGTTQYEAHADAQVFFSSLECVFTKRCNVRGKSICLRPSFLSVDSWSQGTINQVFILDWLY